MEELFDKLEQIQELDLQIDSLTRKKNELPARLAQLQLEQSEYSKKFEDKKKIVEEFERNRRQQLGALELNEERIKRSEVKLEQIKTNQEFQGLQKEIESLKKNSAVIQENEKKVYEELQRHSKELAEIETALKSVQEKIDTQSNTNASEDQVLTKSLTELTEKRDGFIKGVDVRYLAQYNRIRAGRAGVGIAHAIGGGCKGCNIQLPPQMYNELQRGRELHFCPNCKRILIYRLSNNSPNAGPSASA